MTLASGTSSGIVGLIIVNRFASLLPRLVDDVAFRASPPSPTPIAPFGVLVEVEEEPEERRVFLTRSSAACRSDSVSPLAITGELIDTVFMRTG